jgi:hypothetical protein
MGGIMPEWLNIVQSFIKLAPRYIVVIGIVAFTILFIDERILVTLGLLDFKNNFRQWIALTALIGIGFIVIDFIVWCWKRTVHIAINLKMRQDIKRYLRGLTEEEKEILRFYISQQTRTNSLSPDDGVVNGLEHAGIIYQATFYGSILNGHPFNITPHAWGYLNKNKFLLEGKTSNQRTDKVD